MTGRTLGHYRVEEKLGEGGMGVVYGARDLHLDRPVAIKVLRPDRVADPERKRRFVQEAKAASALNHPNIITIYDIDATDGIDFIAMEYVPGGSLDGRIGHRGLPLGETLKYAVQISDALAAAHEAGIVHRDLKPGNVMVTDKGQVKLLDFGLAKLTERSEADPLGATETVGPRTREGAIIGTVAYMSPEQAEGKKLDARSDIFSFGSVLYEMVTGRRPFQGETQISTLSAILHIEPQPVSEIAEGVPRDLEKIVLRCLRKDRARRHQHMDDVKNLLEELKEESVSGRLLPEAPSSAAPGAIRWKGRRWMLAAAAGGVALGTFITWLAIRPTGLTPANVPQLVSVARLTHDPEFSESPTWSPDGSLLAFASNRSGNFEIYVRRVGGGQEVNVSNDPGQDFQPAFSPDGNWIAFASTRSSRTGMVKIGGTFGTEFRTLGGDVWVVPALGGQARLLGKDGNFPAWHPSGRKLAYLSGPENHRSILEVAAEGGTPRSLLPGESSKWAIEGLQYSPGGSWVTFETWEREIFIMPAAEGSPRKLLNGVSHVWDPSGKRLYYCTRDPLGGTRLQSVEMDESTGELRGKPQTLALMTGILRELAISRDGQQFAVSELEGAMNLTRLPLTAEGGSPAGPEEVLSRGQVFDRYPAVSPDGRSIAYTSNRLGLGELWMLHLDTKRLERLQLPGRDIQASGPRWFPDGRRLGVVRSSPDGKQSLWIVAADGSQAEELVSSLQWQAGTDGFPVSPDGHHVVYAARAEQHYQLFSFDINARQARQLTFSPDDKLNACWSPDGRWLVYPSNASGYIQLWRIPATGGQPQRLTEGSDRIRHMFYSSDSRWLYFQPNHLNIYRMPAAGGPVQQVTRFPESGLYLEEPTISPDSRYLVYCRSNGGSSLWLLKIGTAGSGSN